MTDLGTEFTVEVQQSGAVEVYVLQGEVETTRHSRASATPVKEHIAAGQALRFVSADAASQRITGRSAASATGLLQAVSKARRSLPLLASNVLATAYHRVWSSTGVRLEDDRRRAFLAVTDSVVGRGQDDAEPRSSFDTLAPNRSKTDFVGLFYDHPVRIDRVKVCLGRQFGDGGSWRQPPRVFILKNPVDTNQTPPENDPVNWRELPTQMIFGRAFDAQPEANPGRCLEFVLTGYSEQDRTGYGWAVGGVPGNGPAGYLSVTKLFAFGAAVKTGNDLSGNSIAPRFRGPWRLVDCVSGRVLPMILTVRRSIRPGPQVFRPATAGTLARGHLGRLQGGELAVDRVADQRQPRALFYRTCGP